MTRQHPHEDEQRRALEEAAIREEDDPRRRALLDELEREGSDRRRRMWCEILSENEDLRLRLRHVEAPVDLAGRVRSIRRGHRPSAPGRRVSRTGVGVAVAVLLVAGAVLSALLGPSLGVDGDSRRRALRELALLATLDNAGRPELTVSASRLGDLASGLGERSPFPLRIQRPARETRLLGGRVCTFDERPLLYTRWAREGGGTLGVYQVDRRQFGLGAGIPETRVEIGRRGSPEAHCRVRLWTEERFGFIIVEPVKGPGS